MAKFTLDVNANLEDLTSGLKNAQEDLTDIGEKAIKTGRDIQNSFNQATGSAEKFQKTLKEQFLFYGKAEIEIKKLKAAIKSTFDPAVVAELKKQLKSTTDSVIAFASASSVAENSTKSLRAQLKENKAALAEMEEQGLETTDAFFRLQVQTGQLQDQINDTNERIKFFASDTRGLDGLIAITKVATAGFGVAQGAAALFGDENQDLQKALLKVNAAMAILNGLQEIQAALQKSSAARLTIENALSKIKLFFLGAETTATEGLTAAQIKAAASAKILRVALISTGIGAIITLLGLAANAMGFFDDKIVDTTEDIEKQREALENYQATLKFTTDLQIAQARRLGASEETVRSIEKEGIKQRIELLEGFVNERRSIFDKAQQELEEAEKKVVFRSVTNNKKEIKQKLEVFEKEKKNFEDAQTELTELRRQFAIQNIENDTISQKETREQNEKFEKEQEDKLKRHLERMKAIRDGNNANRIAALQDSFEKELLQLEENQRKELASAKTQGLDLKLLRARFEKERIDLTEKFARQGRDLADAETQRQNQEREDEQKRILEAQLDFIDDMEKIRLLELDIEFESGEKSIKETRRIAEEKLKIEIQSAQDRLKLINPDSPEGKALELAIIQAQNKIKELGKDNPILSALGLDNFSEEDLQIVKSNLATLQSSLKDIVIGLADDAIESNRNILDSLDEQIDKVRANIEKQKQLQDEGRSNNLEQEQANLAKLEEQRRAAFEKDKKLQKEKLAADAASQLSSLITATAKIFEAYASIPFAGQVLAIGAIATMFASFALSQVRARKAINEQSFKGGGVIKGKRHNPDGSGGEKYVSEDGNSVRWIEDEEYVVKRGMSMKYRKLLDAINNDSLNNMLSGTGVVINPEKVDGYKQLKQSYADKELRYRIQLQSDAGNKEISALRKDFNKEMKVLSDKPSITVQGGYRIETRGNRTIRTKL